MSEERLPNNSLREILREEPVAPRIRAPREQDPYSLST